jgi:hypothetical protein
MSGLKVVPMSSHADANNLEVIRRLDEAAALAREGHCHSLALVMLDAEGNCIDGWHNGGRPFVMIGALEALKQEFIAATIEPRANRE